MKDYSEKVASVQQQLAEALEGAQGVTMTLQPRKWDGRTFPNYMVPIAIIRKSIGADDLNGIVEKIVSDNRVTMMVRRDGRFRVRAMVVYIQRKKEELTSGT